ncbi:MAG: hydroxymethylbilane synthase [Polyangiales bacterium]
MRLVVATRKSALALAQCRAFVRALIAANPGLEVEELHVVTSGDRIQDRPLNEVGGKGLFVKEIEEALLDGRAHFAVHSMKDLPAEQPGGLVIACVPERADPRDVLLVRRDLAPSFASLPQGARVGSSSLRRRTAILKSRPDLVVEPLRGNVDTRLKKLDSGSHDAIILAAAGLARLGIDAAQLPPHAHLDTKTMLPAVAQGILAIETREGDRDTMAALAKLEHGPSRLRASAERGVLKALGADCTVPLAAFSQLVGEEIHLEAWLATDAGFREESTKAKVADAAAAEALGLAVGKRLLG